MGPNPPCLLPTRSENEATPEYLGLSNLNLRSTEPRKYIKRDRPRSIAATESSKHINAMNNQASTSTPQLSNLSSSSSSSERVKKIKIVSPSGSDKKSNRTVQNGDEWTEISLNNSPDEICYSDEDEPPIPYKPLPMDFSPEPESREKITKKKLIAQQSLPAISKTNDDEVTRSPSLKNKTKLDTSLASWISRSSAGGDVSCGSSSESLLVDLTAPRI